MEETAEIDIEVEEIVINGITYYITESGEIYDTEHIKHIGHMKDGIASWIEDPSSVKRVFLNNIPASAIIKKDTVEKTATKTHVIIEDDIGGLNEKQRRAMALFNSGQNIFLTGPGGVGKSHLIRQMVDSAKTHGKTAAVCAMTGCAAVQLKCGATTLHSWSGIRLAKDENWMTIQQVLKNKPAATRWRAVDILIVDEISMMSKKIFELIEELGRTLRRSVRPFGGIQVVFCGDFFQLPPVGSPDEPDTMLMCFESPRWDKAFLLSQCVELDKLYRQTDPEFVQILSEIRVGTISEYGVETLRKCVNKSKDEDMVFPTKLFPTKQKAEAVNKTMFAKLPDPTYVSKCSVETGVVAYVESNKPIDAALLKTCMKLTPAEVEREINFLKTNIPPEEEVKFKRGAVVMCLVNLAVELGICNGSVGVVTDIYMKQGMSLPVVRFRNNVLLPIERHAWQSEQYPTIVVKQLPLMLAWATTIHKGQGATMDVAEMDIGKSIFEYGQAYVGLSRVRTLDGLYLTEFNPVAIRADPKVVGFYERIREARIVEANTTKMATSTSKKTSDTSGEIVLEECPVCYERIQSTNVCTTACGHTYCLKCMLETYKMDSKQQCPICRANL
jgi:ATP-dependent DNA helicase PIF1